MGAWEDTLAEGKKYEDFCLMEINKKALPLAYKNMKKEEYSYYDLILFDGNVSRLDKQQTVECKFDKKGAETGNICIEVGCNGKLSGLLVTKADFWFISDGITMYIAKTSRIHDCIVDNMDKLRYIPKCNVEQEDGVFKEMDIYLIPRRIFELYCEEFGNINNITYICLL